MHLTTDEVARFYSVWFSLLHYVNQKLNLVSAFPAKWGGMGVSPEVAVPLRDALWEDDKLREAFIAENPAHLNADDLALVKSWKQRIAGEFFIFRHLKKYSVFIDSESPAHGYGVLGLTSPIQEVIGPYLPIYVNAVLIPFGDRIIYDGLLAAYPVLFGAGYRSSLKDAYQEIQERGGIITNLLKADENIHPERVEASNKKVLAAFQKSLGKSGLSPKMIEEHTSNLAHFADEFLLKQTPPGMLLDLTRGDLEAYRKLHSKINGVSFKRFLWFLRDTGRVDWDEAEKLLKYLKDE